MDLKQCQKNDTFLRFLSGYTSEEAFLKWENKVIGALHCCEDLVVKEVRSEKKDSAELVIPTDNVDKWHRALEKLLGNPIYSDTDKENMTNMAKAFGGLREGQCMYYREGILVMVWPWNNGLFSTLKKIIL